MTEPYVYLSWQAQRDLGRLEVGTGREIGAGLLGRVEGHRIAVDRIIQNRCGPYAPDETPIDFAYFRTFERVASSDQDECKLQGSLHSHERYEAAGPIASPADLRHVREAAQRIPGQISFAMVIVGPGFHSDWGAPQLRAWVARPDGEVWVAEIVREERWLAELERTVKFRPRRSWSHAEDTQ